MRTGDGKKAGDRSRAILFLLGAAVLWSTGGLLIKWVSWGPLAIAGTRSLIAALVIIAYIRRPRLTWSAAQVGGALAYACTVILFVMANKLTTAANAIVLQYTCPVYVAILAAVFLKERTSCASMLAIAGALGGMVLFFLDRLSPGGLLGNVLAIVSGVSLAFLVIFLRMQKDASPMESILLGNIITVVVCLPFMLRSAPPALSWIALILLGVFQLGISYMLYSTAIKHVAAVDAILIPVIEPLLNPLWVFLLLGETPGPWAAAGGVIVLASVTVYSVMTLGKSPA